MQPPRPAPDRVTRWGRYIRDGVRQPMSLTIALRVAWWTGAAVVAGLGALAALFVMPAAALVLIVGAAAAVSLLPWLPPNRTDQDADEPAARARVAVGA